MKFCIKARSWTIFDFHRSLYLICAYLDQTGHTVLLISRPAPHMKAIEPPDFKYFKKIYNLKNIIVTNCPPIDCENYTYLNVDRDAEYCHLPWKNIIFVGSVSKGGPIGSHPRVDKYLCLPIFGMLSLNKNREFEKLSFFPHPVHIENKKNYIRRPAMERKFRLNALMAPSTYIGRVEYYRRLRKLLDKNENFYDWPKHPDLNIDRLPSNAILISDESKYRVPENSYFEFLNDNLFTFDVRGTAPADHRVIEATKVGSVPILMEESLVAFYPPLEDGVNCLAYNDQTFEDVIQNAINMPVSEVEMLSKAAYHYYKTYCEPDAYVKRLVNIVQGTPRREPNWSDRIHHQITQIKNKLKSIYRITKNTFGRE